MESASGGGDGGWATGWLSISGVWSHDITHGGHDTSHGRQWLNSGSLAFADVGPGNQFQWSQAFSADVDSGVDENRAPRREILGVEYGEVDEAILLNQPGEDKHTLYEPWS